MIFLIFYYIHLWYWYDYKKKEEEKKKLHNFLLSYSTYFFPSMTIMITFHHITLHVSFVSDNFFRYTFR